MAVAKKNMMTNSQIILLLNLKLLMNFFMVPLLVPSFSPVYHRKGFFEYRGLSNFSVKAYLSLYPFTAPAVSPAINCLFANKYTMRIGIMAMEAPASMMCHSAAALTEYFSCTTATVKV